MNEKGIEKQRMNCIKAIVKNFCFKQIRIILPLIYFSINFGQAYDNVYGTGSDG